MPSGSGMTMRLVDTLYVEAMVLADEARSYFDDRGRVEREALSPIERVAFTCESLKVTTRLMHIIAWLLTRRAVEAGELSRHEARDPARRLGRIEPRVEGENLLPDMAESLIGASNDLYERVRRLDESLDRTVAAPSPALGLIRRLENAF
jgi:regulator of CtrA degradation